MFTMADTMINTLVHQFHACAIFLQHIFDDSNGLQKFLIISNVTPDFILFLFFQEYIPNEQQSVRDYSNWQTLFSFDIAYKCTVELIDACCTRPSATIHRAVQYYALKNCDPLIQKKSSYALLDNLNVSSFCFNANVNKSCNVRIKFLFYPRF